MNTPRIARSLAAVALALGLLIGVAGPAHAAYPPGGVGTIKVFHMECFYKDDGTFSQAGPFHFVYEVETPTAELTVTREDGTVIHTETVSMGRGTFRYWPSGLAYFQSYTAVLTGDTGSGSDTVSATAQACPSFYPPAVKRPTAEAKPAAKAAAATGTDTTPVTGSETWIFATIAAVLVLGGVAMVTASRRRWAVR